MDILCGVRLRHIQITVACIIYITPVLHVLFTRRSSRITNSQIIKHPNRSLPNAEHAHSPATSTQEAYRFLRPTCDFLKALKWKEAYRFPTYLGRSARTYSRKWRRPLRSIHRTKHPPSRVVRKEGWKPLQHSFLRKTKRVIYAIETRNLGASERK